MGKILVIAEKPSVGKDIAKVLGCDKKGKGFIFSDTYIVSWAIGHLITLCDPEDYNDAWKKWSYVTLPIIPEQIKLKPIKKTKDQLIILKKLMNDSNTDEIICATDSGREGELIFRYIYHYVKCKKPFKRLWISSMTDTAIKSGFNNLKDGFEYEKLFQSAKCRSEADWLVGINASRAYTLKYNTLLSLGRVQTPTLAILVARQLEINNFKPVDYWELKVKFDSENNETYMATWWDEKNNETKIYDLKKAEEIDQKIKDKIGHIKSLETEEKKQPAPLLYDLTELQRDCNKIFGISAKTTLSTAQDLYEKRKLITYPRTDSRYLSDDMISKIEPALQNLKFGEYEKYVDYILGLDELPITKRIVDNKKITDHHAIIPTEKKPKLESLSDIELKVYDLIVRRFMSVFYPPYIYNSTKIVTVVENECFITKGTTVVQLGFTQLSKSKKEKDEDILPNVTLNESVTVSEQSILKKKTEPPKPYTEASLLSAMENAGRFIEDENIKEQLKDSGLGTPATRAAIIERLLDVGYTIRKGKTILPTEKGIQLIQVIPHELKSAETTGKWEKGLSSIAKGKMQDVRFMSSIDRYVAFLVDASKKADTNIVFKDDRKMSIKQKVFGNCPDCADGKILENTRAYYCTNWKSGCKFNIWKDKFNGKLTQDIINSYSKGVK